MKNTNSDPKKTIKQLLRNYTRMDRKLMHQLEALGIRVEFASKHVKLFYNNKIYICSASSSDYREGRNLAALICNAM